MSNRFEQIVDDNLDNERDLDEEFYAELTRYEDAADSYRKGER